MEFENRNVIVTGGANGIGRAVVDGVIAEGGHAVILDMNLEASKAVQQQLGKEKVSVYQMNLADSQGIRDVMDQVIKDLGQVHVLVNCAGIVNTKPFDEIGQEEWERVININLNGTYTAISAVYPHMKKNRYGRIVNVASVAAKRGGGLLGTSAYATSKAGVIGLTKAIAREGGPYGIACNAVCPAFTLTHMLDSMSKELQEQLAASMPLRRGAQPEEVANMILFLASDRASFITGEISDADGGITMDG